MADIIFSRSVRRQLFNIDLVHTLVENLQKTNQLDSKQKACIQRINKRMQNIYDRLCGKKEFSAKNLKKYMKTIDKIKAIIMSLDKDQLSHEFYNAVLLNVEDTRVDVQHSKHKKLKTDWNFLNQSLYTLYTYADIANPEEEYLYCISGHKIGRRLQSVIQ